MNFSPETGENENPENTKEQELIDMIERQRIGDANKMMIDLKQLRAKGAELSDEGKEALEMLKLMIEDYLAEGK